jgi:hypothetical protein
VEHLIGESDAEYKMGRALPVKYSEYFGAKRRKSLKNKNIRYDTFKRDDTKSIIQAWFNFIEAI